MHALSMAAAYALISILSATGGIVLLWPSFGWWSLASAWPVGSLSCLGAALVVGLARSRRGHDDLEHLTDGMVSDLRGVLENAHRQPIAGEDHRHSDERRSAG